MQLMTASEPTAMMGGTPNTEMSSGRSNMPPPSPVKPTRNPTTTPTLILAVIVPKSTATPLHSPMSKLRPSQCSRSLGRKILQNRGDNLGGTLPGAFLIGVTDDFRCYRRLIGIINPSEA